MKKIFYQSCLLFCVVYTVTTIISSILQLTIQGREFDSNSHLLNRAIIVFIGICTLQIIQYAKFKCKALNIIVPYCVSMGLVFLYVFVASFFEELHPNAYRDIFLNYTISFIIVTVIITIIEYFKKYKKIKSD